ncbi:nascent polypeptide-associated complex subunit alpha, muscle-specific form [Drosophila busckii]|uniref:nascent polypeptide-associated complex subunit alpha, muscle-specific form n=1 Tax=Drosophila busckii TaxID=30019 RepID=UPI00083EE3DB|nr:nascent polypeptide-associated complex subunit alpha, muscle-specific form [Drosophila busckii]
MDPEQKKEEQERQQQQQQQAKRSSPHIFKFDEHQSYLNQHQRKDSASSEVAALLCISGRTSRISSVGSQGSAVSRLSAISCVSRSPSPHRMLLETSFCGPKPVEAAGVDGVASNASTAPSSAQSLGEATLAVEQLLLARTKHDTTQVVLAEGMQMQLPMSPAAAARARAKSKPMVIGKTASGTEYIRINLRPDHMYSDKGIAANERVVEAPNQLTPVYSKSAKPATLSLQAGGGVEEQRLTPTASPKPARHALRLSSRSPSPAPAAVAASPGKRGSSDATKSSSPIDCMEPPPAPPPLPTGGGGTRPPSRPNSRLRYYDEPVEGYIHIPLHTPPEEREARTLLQGIQQLAAPSPPPLLRTPTPTRTVTSVVSATINSQPAPAGAGAPITASQLAAAAAALRPVGQRVKAPERADLNAIQTLPSQEEFPAAAAAPAAAPAQQNGLAEMQRLPSVDSNQSSCEPRLVHTVATVNASAPAMEDAVAKERRRLLFATRLGSGSQEQIFSTQFSISKTESQSSQLSEQLQLPDCAAGDSPASDGGAATDGLQRQSTVIRRPDYAPRSIVTAAPSSSEEEQASPRVATTAAVVVMRAKHKSSSNSEEEAASTPQPKPLPPAPDVRHSRYLENFDVRKKYHENVPATPTPTQTAAPPAVPRKPKRQSVPENKRECDKFTNYRYYRLAYI